MAGWINSLLPREHKVTYVEPFAGMLSVLLIRPPSWTEIANDLNDRVVNWWQVVRDKPDELFHKMAFSPISETDFHYCRNTIDEGSEVDRAMKFGVLLTNSVSALETRGTFGVRYSVANYAKRSRDFERFLEHCHAVANRLRNVQLLNRDAIELLERLQGIPHAVIYCDPPYPSRRNEYGQDVKDYDALAETLLRQSGRVAISGVGDEWNHLGWERHERPITRRMGVRKPGQLQRPDTEVVWTNYSLETQENQQYELV